MLQELGTTRRRIRGRLMRHSEPGSGALLSRNSEKPICKHEKEPMDTGEQAEMTRDVDIIFLNGTSSSGKSTVAHALREKLEGVWLHVTLDAFFRLLPPDFMQDPTWGDRLDWDEVLTGFHAMVAQIPRTGYPVILDHVCTSRRWRNQCVDMFREHRVLYVGVRCPLTELRRREEVRGDRKLAIAEEHLSMYDKAGPFDVEVNTYASTPEECAEQILAAMTNPKAFRQIREELKREEAQQSARGDAGDRAPQP